MLTNALTALTTATMATATPTTSSRPGRSWRNVKPVVASGDDEDTGAGYQPDLGTMRRELDDLLERRPVLPVDERLRDDAERPEADRVELRHRLAGVAARLLVCHQRGRLRPARDVRRAVGLPQCGEGL